jgi:hypothetical protein
VGRHEREIFPLLRKRYLFAEVDQFLLYDLYTPHGAVDEDVIAYSNRAGHERSLVVVHNKFKDTRGHLRMSAGFLNKGGAIVQRSLSDGLALPVDGPGGKDYFVVFRDAITGLEYLRETRDLAEKGLYVELGAFKYHVFWEFRDVESTAQTPYRALAEELAGRGVPSIDDALIDWIHRSVHTSFYEAIRPESIDYLARGWDAEEDAPSKECEGALHEKLRHVLEGIAYAHGSQGDMLPVHADLETRYDNLMRWSTWAATANHPLSAGGTHVLLAWAFTGALEHIRGRMGQAHGKQRAWHGWALARVVERAFRARGVEEATARRWTTLLEFFALEPWTWTPHAPLSLRQLTLALISSPSARIVVGANTFEGVTYVSKDLLEEALLFGEGYLAMEQAADEGSETSSETLLEAYEKLHQERGALLKSAEAVGFVLDAFRTRLAPPVSRPQTAAVPAPPAHG